MAWRSAGALTRSLSRVSSLRSPPPVPRLRPPQAASHPQVRRRYFVAARNMGELGCTASFLPLQSTMAAARIMSVNPRAFSEMSHGTFCRTCQDR